MVIDLTGIGVSLIGMATTILAVALPSVMDRHMRRQQARDVLRHAIRASVGALQQSGTMAGHMLATGPEIPEVPMKIQPAVRYVLDNAGPEVALLDLGPEQIAKKVLAQIGLTQIAVNTAVASNASPLVPDPLGPLVTTATLPVGRSQP